MIMAGYKTVVAYLSAVAMAAIFTGSYFLLTPVFNNFGNALNNAYDASVSNSTYQNVLNLVLANTNRNFQYAFLVLVAGAVLFMFLYVWRNESDSGYEY